MNIKSIIGVIIVAILIGVLYVVFEKNFSGEALTNSESSSAQELSKENIAQETMQQSSLMNLPTPEPSPGALTDSSDLLQETRGLQMRDYSTYFEELKDTVSSQ